MLNAVIYSKKKELLFIQIQQLSIYFRVLVNCISHRSGSQINAGE